MNLQAILAALVLWAGFGGAVLAQPTAPAPAYSNPANWLCWPGRADACKVDLSATVVSTSGRTSLEEFNPPRTPPAIDCFYVYPTVSLDPTPLSDLTPGPEERSVVASQFARFGASCRQFAPLYRQVTLTALREVMADGGDAPAVLAPRMATGYADLVAAWNHYLATENKGRGVVLIGHSQGTAMLIRLMQQEIDGKPIQKQLVGAILLGGSVQVPSGGTVGGTFKAVPVCAPKQPNFGCVITYSSFRDNVPPSADSLFGRNAPGTVTACTNPADLKALSGPGTPVSYFAAARPNNPVTGEQQGWMTPFQPIGTPFVRAPGFVTTACVSHDGFSYLQVHVNGNPKDARTDTLTGDVMTGSQINAAWGLHLIDMNLTIGDLVRIVGVQGQAWQRAQPRRR